MTTIARDTSTEAQNWLAASEAAFKEGYRLQARSEITNVHEAWANSATLQTLRMEGEPASEVLLSQQSSSGQNLYAAFWMGSRQAHFDRSLKFDESHAWESSEVRLHAAGEYLYELETPQEAAARAGFRYIEPESEFRELPDLHSFEEMHYLLERADHIPRDVYEQAVDVYHSGPAARTLIAAIHEVRPYLGEGRFHALELYGEPTSLGLVIDRDGRDTHLFGSLADAEGATNRAILREVAARESPEINDQIRATLRAESRESIKEHNLQEERFDLPDMNPEVLSDKQLAALKHEWALTPEAEIVYERIRAEAVTDVTETFFDTPEEDRGNLFVPEHWEEAAPLRAAIQKAREIYGEPDHTRPGEIRFPHTLTGDPDVDQVAQMHHRYAEYERLTEVIRGSVEKTQKLSNAEKDLEFASRSVENAAAQFRDKLALVFKNPEAIEDVVRNLSPAARQEMLQMIQSNPREFAAISPLMKGDVAEAAKTASWRGNDLHNALEWRNTAVVRAQGTLGLEGALLGRPELVRETFRGAIHAIENQSTDARLQLKRFLRATGGRIKLTELNQAFEALSPTQQLRAAQAAPALHTLRESLSLSGPSDGMGF